ncbi:hypothetical protein D3C81_648610 [compost metagenome]
MAAEDLLAVEGGFQAHVGEEGLGHRGQQRYQILRALACRCVFAVLGDVQLQGHVAGERTAAFVQGFHGQQHAAHVRVHDDRVGRLVLVLRAGRCAALQAVTGVGDGVLVRTLALRQALDAHAQTLVVHHGEHRRQAFVRCVDDPAGGAVEVHHAGGGGLDAHLVFDGATRQRIVFTQRTVGVDQHLGHQEQRDALRPRRCIRQARQYQVDDVFGQVVVATADENLAAADCVAAISLGLGLGADQPQIGAGVGLGQAHRTGPGAGVHVWQIAFLEFLAGVGLECQAGTRRQHRVQAERQIGRVDHFFNLGGDRLGHAHAAKLRIATDTAPATFGKGTIGCRETVRRGHFTVVPGAALLVATAQQRSDDICADVAGLFKDRGCRLFVDHLGQPGQLSPKSGHLENFIENEAHVAQGGFVNRHDWLTRTL